MHKRHHQFLAASEHSLCKTGIVGIPDQIVQHGIRAIAKQATAM
jgi:hypothetical protein